MKSDDYQIILGRNVAKQLQQFSERRVAYSDRIARVQIFLAMTINIYIFDLCEIKYQFRF